MNSKTLILSIVYILTYKASEAQVDIKASLNIIEKIEAYGNSYPSEKIYINCDRNVAIPGESLNCYVYSIDGNNSQPSALSKIAYLQWVNALSGEIAKEYKLELQDGQNSCSIIVPEKISGPYYIRDFSSYSIREQDFFNFPIFVHTGQEKKELEKILLPTEKNVTFFPEGGNLIDHLSTRVGVRLSTGLIDAKKGWIIDQFDKEVAQVDFNELGLGSFFFTPILDAHYRLKIDKIDTLFVLPHVEKEGYSLALVEQENRWKISIAAISVPEESGSKLKLIVTQGTSVLYSAETKSRFPVVTYLDKPSFPDGLLRLTLIDEKNHLIAERLFFKSNFQNELSLELYDSLLSNRQNLKAKIELLQPSKVHLWASLGKYTNHNSNLKVYASLVSELDWQYYPDKNILSSPRNLDQYLLCNTPRRNKWTEVLAPNPNRSFPEIDDFLTIRGNVLLNDSITELDSVRVNFFLSGNKIIYETYITKQKKSFNLPIFNFNDTDIALICFTNKDYKPLEGRLELLYTTQSKFIPPFSYWQTAFKNMDILDSYYNEALAIKQVNKVYQSASQSKENVKSVEKMRINNLDGVDFSIKLDDYVSFPSMEELFRELLEFALYRKKKDQHFIRVYSKEYARNFEFTPLILIDGLPEFDHDKLMSFLPSAIEKIEIINSQKNLAQFGTLGANGIILIKTKKGTYQPSKESSQIEVIEGFLSPIASVEKMTLLEDKQPDLKTLLLWKTCSSSTEISFRSSDFSGSYILMAEGKVGSNWVWKEIPFAVK